MGKSKACDSGAHCDSEADGAPAAKCARTMLVDVDPLVEFEANGDFQVFFDDGSSVKVYSALLGLASPFFAAMFRSGMKEATERRTTLPGKNKETFELLMAFLKPASDSVITEQNVDMLLPMVSEFQIDSLLKKCEHFLLSLPLERGHICSRLKQAHMCGLESQYKRCLKDLTHVEFKDNIDMILDDKEIIDDALEHFKEFEPSLTKLAPMVRKAASNADIRSKALPFLKVALENLDHVDTMTIVALSLLCLETKSDVSSDLGSVVHCPEVLAEMAKHHFEGVVEKSKAAAVAAKVAAESEAKAKASKTKRHIRSIFAIWRRVHRDDSLGSALEILQDRMLDLFPSE